MSTPTSPLTLTGQLTPDGTGGFTMSLVATADTTPNPEPPPTGTVITPSGGDDTSKIQSALNSLPSGDTLVCSGMFLVGNSIYIDGPGKSMIGDPGKPSGFRSTNAGIMSGGYGAMFCTTPTWKNGRIANLEFDGQGHPSEMIFMDYGELNLIEGCYLHDINPHPGGPPYAFIHSQGVLDLIVRNNRCERTGLDVRGIWICGRSGVLIESNIVSDTNHTAIIADASSALLFRNQATRSIGGGSGLKLLYRPSNRRATERDASAVLIARDNIVKTTDGAGLMTENIGNAPGGVLIEGNEFYDCGKTGTTFGAYYNSKPANGVLFRNNRMERCRSVAGCSFLTNSNFENNTIVNSSSNVNLESDCSYITLIKSGMATIGPRVNHVTVDGRVVA